jgi:cob(I)alamin adenosyltransferase
MPTLSKIYTRGGDGGETSLGGGQRVPKDDARVEAYGTVDELNAVLGTAAALGISEAGLSERLLEIQNALFNLGSDLCFREEDKAKFSAGLPKVEERHVAALEASIDLMNGKLGALKNFILPGGSPAAAQLHLARAVCRRAERRLATLSHREAVSPWTVRYLNRLSDWLFVAARFENLHAGVAESLWNSRA